MRDYYNSSEFRQLVHFNCRGYDGLGMGSLRSWTDGGNEFWDEIFLAVSFVFSEKRIGRGGKLCVYTIDFMLWLCTTGNIGKTKEILSTSNSVWIHCEKGEFKIFCNKRRRRLIKGSCCLDGCCRHERRVTNFISFYWDFHSWKIIVGRVLYHLGLFGWVT